MRLTPYIAVLAAVSGCSAFPVAMVDHTSNPNAGQYSPNPEVCDTTADFAGGGVGWEAGNNRVYLAFGQKHIRQCGAPDHKGLGGKVLYIHEFRRE